MGAPALAPAASAGADDLALRLDGVTVTFDTGGSYALSAEYLRVLSPSAEVQGHSPEQKQTVPGKIDVGVMKIEPVGNYAVRITFDDMHSTGIFSWAYLEKLGREHDALWAEYLSELAEKGLSREPAWRR